MLFQCQLNCSLLQRVQSHKILRSAVNWDQWKKFSTIYILTQSVFKDCEGSSSMFRCLGQSSMLRHLAQVLFRHCLGLSSLFRHCLSSSVRLKFSVQTLVRFKFNVQTLVRFKVQPFVTWVQYWNIVHRLRSHWRTNVHNSQTGFDNVTWKLYGIVL